MKLESDHSPSNYTIHSYGPGKVVINEETLTQALIVSPATLIRDWPPQTFEQVEAPHFEQILALEPEIILFGSGASLRFADAAIIARCYERGIGFESMDTAAACRSYTVLMAEGRQVVAALLMI